MAITNFNTGLTRTEVQVAITGFTSDQPYCISVRGSVGAEIILPVWTNQSGNAAAHGHILGEFHGDCILLTVYVDDLGGGLCDFIGPEDSVRAEGNSCW
jgi:hypothetical protein